MENSNIRNIRNRTAEKIHVTGSDKITSILLGAWQCHVTWDRIPMLKVMWNSRWWWGRGSACALEWERMREFERMCKREKEEGINGESQNRGDRKCNARGIHGKEERERERDGAKWKKAKEESDMCLSFSHPAIASCLFRNLFYFFYPFLFNPLLAKNLIYFSARKRAWRWYLRNLPRGRYYIETDMFDWNITMIRINVLNTRIHLWIILQSMDKNNRNYNI